MEGPVTSGEMLYGTACPQNQGHGSVQNVIKSHKKTKKKKGKGIRNLLKRAAFCCGGSNPPPASQEDKEPEEHKEYRMQTMQDHDKDTITATLVGKVGRFDSTTYLHFRDTVERQIAADAGLTLRDSGEITCEHKQKQRFRYSPTHSGKKKFLGQKQAGRKLVPSASRDRGDITSQRTPIRSYEFPGQLQSVSAKSSDKGISAEAAEALNHGLSCSCNSLANESVSSVMEKEVHSWTTQTKAKTSSNSVPSSSNPLGSWGGDLKACIHQISTDINGDVSTEPHHFPRRGRARGRFRNPLSMKTSTLKSLYNFRYFRREPVSQNIGMMNGTGSEYCYPRFAELQARRNTLKDCTDPQLNGYEFEELAHAGWYFNRRTLVTFCCGMEMPMTPNGHPLDVHLGLSPQCEFARHLQKPPVVLGNVDGAIEPETLSAEQPDVLEASGGVSELRFSVPVQATDDVSAGYGISSEAYDVAGFGLLQGAFQESMPGEHYSVEADSYALAGATELSGASAYMENLVTSTTPLASERFQPFSGNPNPAQQRPAGTMQNAFETSGRLFMRGNVQDPLGSARLLRDLEGDNGTGRRSPPDFTPADQINIDGRRDNYRARYPQFGFPTVRNWTFEGWPRTHTQTPSMLADAGFFYAGYGDSVLCYSCGIGVRHWLPMDDPWIEHARWRPSCAYVEAIQGQEFIDAAVELTRNNRHPTYPEVRLEANRRRRAADASNNEDAAPAALPGEDETSMLCKVCYEEEMNTVLMPCRHLAVCEACSGRVGTCPICRTHIESTFRANFG